MKSEITSNIYEPNQNEVFMNKKQVEYFKNRLLEWKKELLKEKEYYTKLGLTSGTID